MIRAPMLPNVALYVVPTSLGRTRDEFANVLARWAEQRQQSTMVVRVSGPVELPGTEYQVWVFETTNRLFELLLGDLASMSRAVAALRLDGTGSRAIGEVRSRDRVYDRMKTERADAIEPLAGKALAAFAGPLGIAPGWLEPWVAAHTASAQTLVLRWRHARPSAPDWPRGYAAPTEQDWTFFDGLDVLPPARC
jgi:hypothetical protein